MNVWTWGGKYFGYIDGDDLWTHNGLNVGRIYAGKIYGPKGNYLGEIMHGDRLITNIASLKQSGPRYTPSSKAIGRVKCVNYTGNAMLNGYQDFPAAEEF